MLSTSHSPQSKVRIEKKRKDEDRKDKNNEGK
jgi:hypothetical protein